MEKLYIIVREDLNPGAVAPQAIHACNKFGVEHNAEFRSWYDLSNNIVVLSVPSEEELFSLAKKLSAAGISISVFREPDMEDTVTAVAAGRGARKFVSNLPCSLRAKKENQAAA